MIHVRTKIQTGISLIATHIHTRTTYTHTLFVAQVQATGWKEDLLSLATIVLSMTSFSTQVFWQWEGRGGRHRPLLECEGWLLWVKPPTYCSWKGWCAGCNLCLDFCQLPLAVPIPESLHLSPWSSATGRADTAVWMLTSPGQALEANRTKTRMVSLAGCQLSSLAALWWCLGVWPEKPGDLMPLEPGLLLVE